MKVVAFSFNGVQPIDSNKEFTSEVLAAAPGKKYITMCEAGGTMKQTVNFPMVSARTPWEGAFGGGRHAASGTTGTGGGGEHAAPS
jgi:hypothetical protein